MPVTEHTNKQYDEDLEAIRTSILQMGGLVESHIRLAIAGYIDGDIEKAMQVIAAVLIRRLGRVRS